MIANKNIFMENKNIEIKKNIADLFNNLSAVYDGSGPRFFKYFGERLVEFAGVKEGEKVLDVACGKGASLFSLTDKVGKNEKVIQMISKDKIEDFKTEVFEKLREIKKSEGIPATMFVLYACCEK